MFETYEEKYNDLEKSYDEKKYDDVVREGGKIVESLVAYIFRNFPSTLKSIKQKQLFVEFEKRFYIDKNNKFQDFVSRPTIGVSIGYYKQLCKLFEDEDHVWLKESIAPALNTANKIRNKFAHAGNNKPDDDDASDLLDAFEIIIEELNLKNETPYSLGIPLSSYLIYSSIIYNFDHIAQKEEDWKKIISDSKKIIPQLLECLFYAKYYNIPIDEKETIFSDDEIFSNKDKENSDQQSSSVFERIFSKIRISNLFNLADCNIDDLMHRYLSNKKEKYDRRGVKPYTKLLDLLAEELINSNYDNYLKFAVLIKNKYLHNNEIDDIERIELISNAKHLGVTPKDSYRIEQEVIRVINNELTLYQTLQTKISDEAAENSISPEERILIEMIKKGTRESIVIEIAESQNFKGDIYQLLSKYSNQAKSAKLEKEAKEEKVKNSETHDIAGLLFNQAMEHFENKDYEKSISDLTKAIKQNPEYEEAYYQRGRSYYRIENYISAIEDFSKVIEFNPNHENVHYFRGSCYFTTEKFKTAIDDLSEAIVQNPKDSDSFFFRGSSYYKLNEDNKAIQDFTKAIQLDPEDAINYYFRGDGYYRLKDYKKAIQDFTNSIKMNSNNGFTYNSRGNCYYYLKEYDKAIQDYDKVLEIEPDNKDALENKKNAIKLKEELNKKTDNIEKDDKPKTESNDFGDFGDVFNNLFGGAFGGRKRKLENDLQVKIPLTLEEISTGITKNNKIKKYNLCTNCNGSGAKDLTNKNACSACNGTGKVNKVTKSLFGNIQTEVVCENCDGFGVEDVEKCPSCNGEGRILEEAIVSVDIPAGAREGQHMLMKGNGNAGRRGGETGDLLCIIEEIKHKYFRREEENLFYDLDLTEGEAKNGKELSIPILNGKIKLKIPAGIQSGKKLRIKGQGLPKLNSSEKGDMYVAIKVLSAIELQNKIMEMRKDRGLS